MLNWDCQWFFEGWKAYTWAQISHYLHLSQYLQECRKQNNRVVLYQSINYITECSCSPNVNVLWSAGISHCWLYIFCSPERVKLIVIEYLRETPVYPLRMFRFWLHIAFNKQSQMRQTSHSIAVDLVTVAWIPGHKRDTSMGINLYNLSLDRTIRNKKHKKSHVFHNVM